MRTAWVVMEWVALIVGAGFSLWGLLTATDTFEPVVFSVVLAIYAALQQEQVKP